MFKNYFITAIRNFIRQKLYSFINVGGLALGIAVTILILLWVNDEVSYDKFNVNFDNIHRVVENQYYAGGEIFPVAVTPSALSKALRDEYPEIINSARFAHWGNTITLNENIFSEDGFCYADSNFFEIFTYQFIQGNPKEALVDPHDVVITQSKAEKYFGDEDPIGKIIYGVGDVGFKITGVIADVPENSHLNFDFIASFEFLKEWGVNMDNWGSNSFYTYVQLKENTDYKIVSDKIKDRIKKDNEGSSTEIYLQPLSKIHLYSAGKYTADIGGHGDIQYVRIFLLIAIFILFIACINFMNLATARSSKRAREVGLRKVVGATRTQIIRQFFGESFFLVLISLILSVIITELVLPFYNELSGKTLDFQIFKPEIIIGLISILIVTAFVSGSYPALFLSSFKPIKVLKGALSVGNKGAGFRKVLVVIQFSVSIFLIIGTLAINKQLNFIQNKKLGYSKENLVFFYGLREIDNEKREALKNELLSNSDIISVAATQQTPLYMGNSSSGWTWEGKETEEKVLFHHNSVDHDFLETFKMEMVKGRFFSREFPTDSISGLVINEEAARVMGMDDPIGKKVYTGSDTLTILGMVKNFHFKPVHTKIEPIILHFSTGRYNSFMVRINSENISEATAFIEKKFKEFAPKSAFELHFLEESLERMYRTEERAKNIFSYFTILAIFIACLGLFGLASYASEQRVKELGIRKALGASISGLTMLLSKDFTRYVIISNIIAWPVAFYLLRGWLENFAYRIDMSVMFFIIAAIVSFMIAMLTVSYHAVKAASMNPVESLRYE